MEWSEVRRLYPHQYVKVEVLKSRIEGNKEIVEDVAIIRSISDPREATKELVNSQGNIWVCHTANKDMVIEIKPSPFKVVG
ncbi:MAG: hypothetical protein M0Z41_03975 [Peptococcaceae bacterium]|jgi:RNA-binding protein YhbY|nr:hypothetical protein [Peptococcaceae bacterium]